MASILNLELRALPQVESDEAAEQASEQDCSPRAVGANSEFEIVLGRTQIASWLFVTVIGIAVCSSLAYLAGEAIAARKTSVNLRPSVVPASPHAAAPAALPLAATLVSAKTDASPFITNSRKSSAPLFGEPQVGQVYLQIGAVERGMAMLLAEGLRSHGFDSFVAPGPNDKIFRVLIGPLPDPAAFQTAMITMNALDLASFARKYQT